MLKSIVQRIYAFQEFWMKAEWASWSIYLRVIYKALYLKDHLLRPSVDALSPQYPIPKSLPISPDSFSSVSFRRLFKKVSAGLPLLLAPCACVGSQSSLRCTLDSNNREKISGIERPKLRQLSTSSRRYGSLTWGEHCRSASFLLQWSPFCW
jgi:hypothetical protein